MQVQAIAYVKVVGHTRNARACATHMRAYSNTSLLELQYVVSGYCSVCILYIMHHIRIQMLVQSENNPMRVLLDF